MYWDCCILLLKVSHLNSPHSWPGCALPQLMNLTGTFAAILELFDKIREFKGNRFFNFMNQPKLKTIYHLDWNFEGILILQSKLKFIQNWLRCDMKTCKFGPNCITKSLMTERGYTLTFETSVPPGGMHLEYLWRMLSAPVNVSTTLTSFKFCLRIRHLGLPDWMVFEHSEDYLGTKCKIVPIDYFH